MKSMIKSISRFSVLLVLLLSTLGIGTAFGSHYAAVDIRVDKIDPTDSINMKYRVTLYIIKACEGTNASQADLSAAETISWGSINGGFSGSRSVPAQVLNPITGAIEDTLDKLCPVFSAQNSCRSASTLYPGYVRRIYTDTFTMPTRQTDTRFSWSSGSRNGTIQNLVNPSSQNIYIEATINNTGTHYGNSSPSYRFAPIPYLCVNQPNVFQNGPIDPDLDSMVTVYNTPLGTGPTNPLAFAAGYSAPNPINSAPTNPYRVIPGNGATYFTPQSTGRYVLAFETKQYDRYTGEYLGHVLRDAQVTVVACAAPPPAIDSVPISMTGGSVIQQGSQGNIISICPNATVTFDIRAQSASGANVILLTSDNAANANGSTFTVGQSGGLATGTFTWTPVTSDIGDHIISFTAKDTTCNPSQPILLENTQLVTIRVLPGIDVGPDRKICPLGDNPVTLSVSGPPRNIYDWRVYGGGPFSATNIDCNNCQVVNVRPPVNTTYVVYSSDPLFACKRSDTVNIIVDNSNAVIATQDPLVVCRPGYITLTADSVGLPPVSNLSCGTANPQNCTNPDQPVIGTLGNTASDPENTPLYSSSSYHKYQFIIPKQDLRNAGVYSGTLKSISFKSNNPTALGTAPLANVKVSLKCTRSTRYPANPANGDFETGTTLVATVASFTVTPNGWNTIAFTTPYNWDTSQNLLVDICMGGMTTPNANGLDPVDMTPGYSIQRYSNTTDVCAGNAITVKGYLQRPVVRFDYCQAPNLPFVYRWGPGTYLSDSNVRNPVAYVPRSGNYAVYTYGRNGCLLRDTLHITVPVHTLSLLPNDTSLCVGQPGRFRASGAAGGYIWYQNGYNTPTTLSCNNCADPVFTATTAGDYLFTVVFLDPNNCFDTLTTKVHVYPLPNVAIVNHDTTIKYGQHVMLMVNGANRYTWTPVGSLDDPNTPNPVASPTETTTYIVYGLSNFQCRNSDTVTINVDKRDNLLIPSGFTPNNDGRNDVFKVVNVTFQKLMEFRVFNRWGQEVFSSTDAGKGWDGKWKGVDQDMGNYSYIIRVAFPDGYVETYKGEVTLIR